MHTSLRSVSLKSTQYNNKGKRSVAKKRQILIWQHAITHYMHALPANTTR